MWSVEYRAFCLSVLNREYGITAFRFIFVYWKHIEALLSPLCGFLIEYGSFKTSYIE